MAERLVTPAALFNTAILPALRLLPPAMMSEQVAAMILMICIYESNLESRWQIIDANDRSKKGPARGFAQFEKGTPKTRGGVTGCYLHPASRFWLSELCKQFKITFDPDSIWNCLEKNDVFAMGVARLMLFTDAAKLPAIENSAAIYQMYLRVWRPGKPDEARWPKAYTEGIKTLRESRK